MESASNVTLWGKPLTRRVDNIRLAVVAGLVLAAVLGGLSSLNPLLGATGGIVVFLLALIRSRPILIVYALTVVLPLTGGLARGAVVPFLRVGQALLIVAFLFFVLAKPGRLGKSRLTAIDLAFAFFVLTEAVLPLLALYYHGEYLSLTATDPLFGTSALQTLLGPLQYYVLYRIVTATISSQRQIIVVLKLMFVTSIIVSIVGILQKLIPAVNRFIATYYPPIAQGYDIPATYQRITSTLQHYSGLGAYLTFTIILALTCYTAQHHLKISPPLLAATFVFDSIALVLTGTVAAWIGFAVGAAVVFVLIRRIPKTAVFILVGIAIAAIIFYPFISARLNDQLGSGAAQGLVPQSLAFRIKLWTEIFLPAIGQNLLFGAGPYPAALINWPAEESQYILTLLRGGLLYFFSYLLLIGVAAFACWRQIKSKSEDAGRTVAIALLAILVAISIMNVSGEYFTYVGGTQILWTLLAIVVASWQLKAFEAPAVDNQIIGSKWHRASRLMRNSAATGVGKPTAEGLLRRETNSLAAYSVIPNYIGLGVNGLDRPDQGIARPKRLLDWHFVKDSALVGLGSTISRVLGLLFSTLLAHFLVPDEFGFVRYAITLAGIVSIAATNGPVSIARFLAAHSNDVEARERYFSNGLVGFAIVLTASLIIAIPILWLLHALSIGTISCIVGLAGFYCYLAIVRGLSSAWKMSLTYVLNNVALVAPLLVVFGLFKVRSATAALLIYGLANLAPLALELIRPMTLRFRPGLVSKNVLLELARFAIPMVMSSAAFAIWFGIDLLMIQNFNPHESGGYAAAKTLAQLYIFVPSAITMVLMPRVAALGVDKSKRYVVGGVLVALLVSLCGFLIVSVWGQKLITLSFGHSYSNAYLPLLMLSVGMCILSVYTVLEGFMIGRGQPKAAAQALLMALTSTCVTGFWLTSWLGGLGASLAFTIGAAIGTLVMLFKTWRFLRKEMQSNATQTIGTTI